MSPIYYDLSEQFLSSGVKFKYYGIARTVMEVGYESMIFYAPSPPTRGGARLGAGPG